MPCYLQLVGRLGLEVFLANILSACYPRVSAAFIPSSLWDLQLRGNWKWFLISCFSSGQLWQVCEPVRGHSWDSQPQASCPCPRTGGREGLGAASRSPCALLVPPFPWDLLPRTPCFGDQTPLCWRNPPPLTHLCPTHQPWVTLARPLPPCSQAEQRLLSHVHSLERRLEALAAEFSSTWQKEAMRLERLELRQGAASQGGDVGGGGLSQEDTLALLDGLVSRREATLKEDLRRDTTARMQVTPPWGGTRAVQGWGRGSTLPGTGL